MTTVQIIAMLSAWGTTVKGDKLYIKNSSTVASGDVKSYYPKFMGFGKSDMIATRGRVVEGQVILWKLYNKSGGVIDSWEKE